MIRTHRTRTALAVTAAIATALALATPVFADEVTNGGFDSGLDGWNAYPNGVSVDGWGCVDVGAGTGAYGSGIIQDLVLDPETTYTLSFDAYVVAEGVLPAIRTVGQLDRDPWTQYLPEVGIAADLAAATVDAPASFEFVFTTPSELPVLSSPGVPDANVELAVAQQIAVNADAYRLCVDNVSLVGGTDVEPYAPDTGPRVRVNHVGYFQYGPKRATLETAATDPVGWSLLDGSGAEVAAGITTPYGFDDAAGLDVHTIDFSGFNGSGDAFTLVADGEASFPFEIGVDDVYEQLRYDALNYYYPARSGIEIDGAIAGAEYARPAGHVSSPADGATNLGDLDVPCQSIANQTGASGNFYYGSEWRCPDGYTLDVVGGWYDAGDHGKYVVNGGISVAQLLGTFERTQTALTADPANLSDGVLKIPESANGVPDVLDEARWELEWMMSMQVPAGSAPQLVDGSWVDVSGLVHHKIHDEGWTGLPLMPHLDPQVRSLHRPSTAATLNFAAVAAQGARLWEPYDGSFAAELLAAGETAYQSALAHPAIFATAADGAEGGGPYDDSDVSDEFYWAAAEMFLTTGRAEYRADVVASPLHTGDAFPDNGFSWGQVAALGRIDLATVPSDIEGRDAIRASIVTAADELLAIQDGESMGHPYAGVGGTYEWGSNSQILNNIVVLGVAYDLTGDDRFSHGAMEAMDYVLGRNSLGWSYLTGYGEPGYNSVNQHSRWWSAQLDPSLPHPPPGSVSGGPNSNFGTWDPVISALYPDRDCAPQRCYVDDIQSWSTNELTINWNAPTAWVANFLADLDDGAAVGQPLCTVEYTSHRWIHGTELVTVRVRNDGETPWRGWDLAWSWSGTEQVLLAAGGRLTQTGADVSVESHGRWHRVNPGRHAKIEMFVRPGDAPGGVPTRFEANGVRCVVGDVAR